MSHQWLIDFCLSQDGLFVIPIEALEPSGIEPGFAGALLETGRVSDGWISQFNRAYSQYRKRARALHLKAPRYWFPPRAQHVAIIDQPDEIRPYFQPFYRNSWLLYKQDFDSRFSTPEFSVFQFFQVERVGLMGSIVPALHANLPYFLTLSAKQQSAFSEGCELTNRPDAEAWKVLGEAQSWLRHLFHESLNPPRINIAGTRIHRENGLIVPPAYVADLAELQEHWGAVAGEVLSDYKEYFGGPSELAGADLMKWLSKEAPQVLITGDEGAVLWDPDQPAAFEKLESALSALTVVGGDRIRQDLEVIDAHSRRFLSSIKNRDELVGPAPYMTAGGLCYIHGERGLIAYDIGAGRNENRLWEVSPPFERWMLGARAVHEWGHLAAESGWVIVPEDRQCEREELIDMLKLLFDKIVATASEAAKRVTIAHTENLKAEHDSVGEGLTRAMLKRIEDYMANLVARQFLSPDEMDTYVRNNVADRVTEYRPEQMYMQLIRLVYEYQYLSLSRIEDPQKWFESSVWIQAWFIDRGAVSRPQFEELVSIVKRICDCYSIDQSKFTLP